MSTTKCVLTVLPFGLKIGNRYTEKGASVVAQMIKNQLAMQETSVQSLGQDDPLEKEMAPHSSVLAWQEHLSAFLPRRLQSSPWDHKELDTTERLHSLNYVGTRVFQICNNRAKFSV